MEKENNYLQSKGKTKLYTQLWNSKTQPVAGLILVHGVGDYSQRYESIANYFSANGISVFLFDLRGHGKSGGKKGHVKKYSTLLNDVNLIVKHTAQKLGNVPLFLYGHGIGGNIALNYCTKYNKNVNGAIITSPWIRLIQNPSMGKLRLVQFLSKIVPYYYVNLDINPDYLIQNNLTVRGLKKDPTVLKRITVSLFNEIHKNCVKVQFNRYKINIPILIMHGKKDKISSYRISKDFAHNTSCFTTKIWEDMYHELHNSKENQKVFDYTLNWIIERL